ncbi:LacI family DNA-binding transcriptional regulator [Epibacterium sp. Ofav1-8]|uniref:LacI family DNA-binding transcriptional regulator n=1 Tax=Epibacterium sp. Ofav1-8 TaxID=2917735 RepID=UPI001EF4F086|nr:LacI family DNA-binding transcriptional regulator [Epibacterium sp. Ofav1-8]MCG7625776.1 LacI family transcriptional regulator [Epibacterium sp. Ofav1-8]
MVRKSATIQDVAVAAGVSTATVSRTLSKPSVVAKATREAVLSAVERTGYRVNATASNLRRQRTGSVIALLPNLANPFFSQILAGMSAVFRQAGYGLLVADTRAEPDPEGRLTHYLRSGLADGIVLLDGTLSAASLTRPARPPVVLACEWMQEDLPSVRSDNAGGGALAVAYLVGMGHRRIGHITGPQGNCLSQTRLDGFQAAITAQGAQTRAAWIFEGDFSMESGAAAAQAWLGLTDRPSAVFCASDEMAIGFMGAVQHRGLRVPEDVSLVGFDNIEVAGHLSPPLTTIQQRRSEIGGRAARLLLDMIDAGSLTGPSETIGVELIERGSVARIAP